MMDEKFIMMFMGSLLQAQKIQVSVEQARTIALSFLSGLSYYLYQNPHVYMDLGRYAIYRNCRLDNLITVEAKAGENAQSIKDYYESGGLQAEEIKEMVYNFARGLVNSARSSQESASDDISKIEELASKKQAIERTNNKEKSNGST